MIQQLIVRRFLMTSLITAVLSVSQLSRAVTILSGPAFTPSADAPLAGTLSLTTDVRSRVSVLVSDGTDVWERDFYDYGTNHSETLLGFTPGDTNQILVTVYDENRNTYTAPELLTFVTAPLPSDFPAYTVLKSEPSKMEPGYLLFVMKMNGYSEDYIIMMDNTGKVVWYKPWSPNVVDVHQLKNGDLFFEQQNPSNNFLEMNMLGESVKILNPPAGHSPVNVHDCVVTDHGTILYIRNAGVTVTNFPSSTASNAPPGTFTVDDNPIVEISYTNGAFLHEWSPLQMLDPTRITYLTSYSGDLFGVDNEHVNAIIDDTNDNSIIVSLRHQNAVFDFSRSGQVKWILGQHANWGTNWQPYLLTPVGTPFNWNYGQHGPDLTPQGTLLVYNNNKDQANPWAPIVTDQSNYSSAVEYDINETNMTVSEVWNSAWQTNQDRLFTPIVGRAQWLPETRNVLVTYGYITYINGVHPSPYSAKATMARIIEYTHDPIPKIVFDVSFFDHNNTSPGYAGNLGYRAYQVPDLYPHPAEPVADLTVHYENQAPLLEFSADPTHNYVIQASTDLKNWTTIGTPVQEGGVGDYDFSDLDANQYLTRYYRVVTE